MGGRVLAGYGLGAVSTRPEARRRGHADALCRHAIAEAEREGRAVGLLYSAIAPAYYERMGFRVVPAWGPVCEKVEALAGSGPTTDLVPLDPRRECARLAEIYERHHGAALHVHRDAEGFARSIALNPDDLFFGIGEPIRGYARITLDETWLDVEELIVPEEERAPTLRALAGLAVRLPRAKLGGWFAPCPDVAAHFEDKGRAKNLPMVRGLAVAPDAQFWPADYF
jgi:hypothetical protein